MVMNENALKSSCIVPLSSPISSVGAQFSIARRERSVHEDGDETREIGQLRNSLLNCTAS